MLRLAQSRGARLCLVSRTVNSVRNGAERLESRGPLWRTWLNYLTSNPRALFSLEKTPCATLLTEVTS